MSLPRPSDRRVTEPAPPASRLQRLAVLAADPHSPATMTYEEFMEWADEDTLAEWVGGKVVMTSPASLKHQLLV